MYKFLIIHQFNTLTNSGWGSTVTTIYSESEYLSEDELNEVKKEIIRQNKDQNIEVKNVVILDVIPLRK